MILSPNLSDFFELTVSVTNGLSSPPPPVVPSSDVKKMLSPQRIN